MSGDDDLSFDDITFGEDRGDLTHEKDDDELKNHSKENEEPEKNVLFISALSYGDKLNSTQVIKAAEAYGALKAHNFREKQSFGFLQFVDSDAYEKAVEKLNNLDVDGTKIVAEKCLRITPGRDPRTHEANSEFKNSTLVLKNLPFQLKQEKLEEILNQYSTKPVNVSYLYDGTGMFRGMAFVKYKEIEHATNVFEHLNNLDITGRKVRVEYKRVTKDNENEKPESADDKKIQDQLNSFKSNMQINELAFNAGSSYQKKQIRHIAEKLGLGTYTSGEFIVIKKSSEERERDRSHSVGSHKESYINGNSAKSPESHYKDSHKGQPIKGRSDSRSSGSDRSGRRGSDAKQGTSYDYHEGFFSPSDKEKSHPKGIAISKSLGGNSPYAHNGMLSSSPINNQMQHLKSPPSSLGSSPTYRHSAAIMNRKDEHIIHPVRQPKGPDGTNGFADEYKQIRAKNPNNILIASTEDKEKLPISPSSSSSTTSTPSSTSTQNTSIPIITTTATTS